AAHRLFLFGDVNGAHAPLADLLQQLVRADHRADVLSYWMSDLKRLIAGGHIKEAVGLIVCRDKQFKLSAQRGVTAACVLEKCRTLLDRFFYCCGKKIFFGPGTHRSPQWRNDETRGQYRNEVGSNRGRNIIVCNCGRFCPTNSEKNWPDQIDPK